MNKQNKKGQEEMFGFVVIIIIVMVIGMVMLAFSFKTKSISTNQKESEINDLTITILSYTTECKNNLNENMSIKELIKESQKNDRDCKGTKELYSAHLKEILPQLTEKALGNEIQLKTAWVKGYELKIMDLTNSNPGDPKEIFILSKGNLTGSYFTSQSYPIPINSYGDMAEVYFKIYYRT